MPYRKELISFEDFEASLHYGCHYEGFVDTLGYVYWGQILGLSPHPSYPNEQSIYVTKGTSFLTEDTYVPMVIPEEEIMKDVKVPIDKIRDTICKINSDGTVTVTLFNNTEVVLQQETARVDITVEEEFFEGITQKTITVRAVDQPSGIIAESKISQAGFFGFTGDMLTYLPFIVGPLSYHMGKHMDEVRRFRPVMQGKYPLQPPPDRFGGYRSPMKSRVYKYGPVPGKVAWPLSRALKWGGAGLGAAGIIYTYYQHESGMISTKKYRFDMFFGVVGFCGLPGMIASLYYFATISPFLDDVITPLARDPNDWSLPQDNTKLVKPYEPIRMKPLR